MSGCCGPSFPGVCYRNTELRVSYTELYGETGLKLNGAGRDFEALRFLCTINGQSMAWAPLGGISHSVLLYSEIICFITPYVSLCLNSRDTF